MRTQKGTPILKPYHIRVRAKSTNMVPIRVSSYIRSCGYDLKMQPVQRYVGPSSPP